MTPRVWIFTKYSRKAASSRLRFYQYLPYLEAAGIDVQLAPLLNDQYLDALYNGSRSSPLSISTQFCRRALQFRQITSGDLILIEGELFPWLPASVEQILLRKHRYCLDYDDALFHRYDLHSRAGIRFLLGNKIDRLMAGAEVVVAGNDYLARRARAAGAAQVQWLPTVVDISRYPLARFHHVSQTPRIGWIGTPITWATYGRTLFEALANRFAETEIEFVAIGASLSERREGNMTLIPWSEDAEAETIATLTTGIMPLENTPWAKGKCGYKLIQYLASGVPVVASPVGANREIVQNGMNGYLAATVEEWAGSILKIASDQERARQMGQMGREWVSRKYSLQATGPRFTEIILNTFSSRKAVTGD